MIVVSCVGLSFSAFNLISSIDSMISRQGTYVRQHITRSDGAENYSRNWGIRGWRIDIGTASASSKEHNIVSAGRIFTEGARRLSGFAASREIEKYAKASKAAPPSAAYSIKGVCSEQLQWGCKARKAMLSFVVCPELS